MEREEAHEKVAIMRSGYSSLIFEMSKVPMPDPVPPLLTKKVSKRREKAEESRWGRIGLEAEESNAPERVSELETLESIARLGLLADNVKNRVDEFSSLSVVTLRPVVTGSRLTEDDVVGTCEGGAGRRREEEV
jgi:hypothetical protein